MSSHHRRALGPSFPAAVVVPAGFVKAFLPDFLSDFSDFLSARPARLLAVLLFAFLAAFPAAPDAALAQDSPKLAPPPSVGEMAPDFALPYATADTIVFEGERLSEALQRGPVVLAFYPADWSPGCTKEVCAFRDAFDRLSELDAQVWAISGDLVFSHRAWAEHHGLPFRLLSDHRAQVAPQYGSFNPESGYNRRTLFVVGEDGRIVFADPEYSVADDADFRALQQSLSGLRARSAPKG